jgi:hypothetical protein
MQRSRGHSWGQRVRQGRAYCLALARAGTHITHWAEVLPQARGKFLAVADQEAFIADTPAEAWACVDAMHPEDNGAFVRYIHPEEGPRIYADRR